MIDVSEADRLLEAHWVTAATRECQLERAVGKVLDEPIRADRDQPPFDRVTVDGFALSTGDLHGMGRLVVQGMQAAGEPPLRLQGPESCIEVMTGSVLPIGCDAVVRIEDVQLNGATLIVREGVPVERLHNVHSQGSDARANEVLVESGVELSPPRIGIAAAVGMTKLRVRGVPRIGVVSTGDELVEVGERPAVHQVRRSNAYALAAALELHGYSGPRLCHLRDDREMLERELGSLLERCDLLILSGGVSKGKFDFVPPVLSDLGVEQHFHTVRQRPGKPLWFGTREGKSVFALPGNPVSALTCLYRYVLPFLTRSGPGPLPIPGRLRVDAPVEGIPGLTRFLPVTLNREAVVGAHPVPNNTSGDLVSLGRSDGFVQIEAGAGTLPPGTELPFYPWASGTGPQVARC